MERWRCTSEWVTTVKRVESGYGRLHAAHRQQLILCVEERASGRCVVSLYCAEVATVVAAQCATRKVKVFLKLAKTSVMHGLLKLWCLLRKDQLSPPHKYVRSEAIRRSLH
jgi:hypothetical protein